MLSKGIVKNDVSFKSYEKVNIEPRDKNDKEKMLGILRTIRNCLTINRWTKRTLKNTDHINKINNNLRIKKIGNLQAIKL